jgi:hypothetical protein
LVSGGRGGFATGLALFILVLGVSTARGCSDAVRAFRTDRADGAHLSSVAVPGHTFPLTRRTGAAGIRAAASLHASRTSVALVGAAVASVDSAADAEIDTGAPGALDPQLDTGFDSDLAAFGVPANKRSGGVSRDGVNRRMNSRVKSPPASNLPVGVGLGK